MRPFKQHSIYDDYRVGTTVLGVGINGKVVEAERRVDGQVFALKCLHDTPKARREVETHLLACSHKNIVTIIDVYENEHEGSPSIFIVMERMNGGELFDRIQERARDAFTEREAATIIHDICLAIQHCHNLNIAHRDLKPENLLYSEPDGGILKLTDFGFARRFDQTTTRTLDTPSYTAYYASPEQLSSRPYDESCDVWSCGVIAYILLVGYPPFYASGGGDISPGMRQRIRAGQYEFPSPEWDAVSNAAKDFIRGCLKTDPVERRTIHELLNHKWLTHFNSNPTTALFTRSILKDQQQHFADLSDEMAKTLASMRVEEINIKKLDCAANPLLQKRRNKAQA